MSAGDGALVESRNWQAVVAGMTKVQKLVHLAYRRTDEDVAICRNEIFAILRDSYSMTIRAEIIGLGCADPGNVTPRSGPELKDMADRAKESAESIVNTFNYDLAMEILRIAEDTPTANRNTYASRLYEWESARNIEKRMQIDSTETGWAINLAKEAFYTYNGEIPAQAEVVPKDTKCPICAEYVAGNPYGSMDELYRKCELPAHPHCPHHGQAITGAPLTRDQCRQLWRG